MCFFWLVSWFFDFWNSIGYVNVPSNAFKAPLICGEVLDGRYLPHARHSLCLQKTGGPGSWHHLLCQQGLEASIGLSAPNDVQSIHHSQSKRVGRTPFGFVLGQVCSKPVLVEAPGLQHLQNVLIGWRSILFQQVGCNALGFGTALIPLGPWEFLRIRRNRMHRIPPWSFSTWFVLTYSGEYMDGTTIWIPLWCFPVA